LILFSGGNLGILFLSGSFVPSAGKLARLLIYSKAYQLALTGKTWG
jgi:hypothetical protein